MGKFAEGTKVPVERSRTEIEKVLVRFGADQLVYASSASPPAALIGFRAKGKLVRFHLPLPESAKNAEAFAAEIRRRWRALLLVLKAKLEAVESGITLFEQEFYAHLLLPGGMTVYETSHKDVERALQTGKPPSFGGLLGFNLEGEKKP